jgi:hypothetical protein
MRALAITAIRRELRRRASLVVGPELEPEEPERLLQINGRCTQLVCVSALADEALVPLGCWSDSATAPQLLLAAVVDEDQGLVEIPGVLDAAAFVAWTRTHGQSQGELVQLPLSMFQGGIARLERWCLLLDAQALPRMALDTDGQSAAGPLVPWLTKGIQTLLDGAMEGLLAALAPQPVPVLSTARGDGPETVQLLNPRIDGERNGMPTAAVICSRPTLWVREPLAEIQLLKDGKLLWRERARLREPITTPLAWPLPPLGGDELVEARLRPWGAPGGNFAALVLAAPSAETLSQGDAEISLRLSQSDVLRNLVNALSAIALEVIARMQSRAQE